VKDQKLQNLYDILELAGRNHFPIIVGTEMNAPGNKFVDTFASAELAPLAPLFLRSAHILYAHTVLQRRSGLGYLSDWAKKSFRSVSARNDFFAEVGTSLQPRNEDRLQGLAPDAAPRQVLDKVI
jgi:hypothetical protein